MLSAKLLGFYIAITSLFCPCKKEDPSLGWQTVRAEYRIERVGRFRLPESSGLAQGPQPGTYYTVQDGGNAPILWLIDEQGTVLDSLPIAADNVDWETLTQSADGRVWVGDLGNNQDWRKDLKIFAANAPGEPLYIRYADQTPEQDHPYTQWDSEGLYHYADSLTWFSKQRQGDSTRVFRIPDQPGRYTVTPVQSLPLARGITGAALRPDGQEVAALGYGRIYFFALEAGQLRPEGCLWWPFNGQAEAILYVDERTLLVTNEAGKIWRVSRR